MLADQFGVDAQVLGEDLVTFMDVESWGWDMDLEIFRPPVIEFGAADEVDPDRDVFDDDVEEFSATTVVRIVHDSPSAGMGVEHLTPGDLATVYTAAMALLDADPDDEELRAALGVIAETMYGERADQPDPAEWNHKLPLLQRACSDRLRVDIVYSRQWHIGISERTIEPLRLVQTKRGWEVDAGPPDAEGRLRTFLLSNIRSAEPRDEAFELPSHLDSRLASQRTTTTVRVALAQDARWAPDLYAEKVDIVSQDDEEFVADLALLLRSRSASRSCCWRAAAPRACSTRRPSYRRRPSTSWHCWDTTSMAEPSVCVGGAS